MSKDDELIDFIDFVYAAVLDGALWPAVLAKLADATGTMQVIIATMDRRTQNFDSISRRTIEELDASYKKYWAFHNPLWAQAAALPSGALFSLDSLMPRQDFAKTAIYNEWWKPADYSLAMLGACLQNDDRLSSVICLVNAPGKDGVTEEQTRIFEKAVRHIARALRIYRQLWTLKHQPFAAAEQLRKLAAREPSLSTLRHMCSTSMRRRGRRSRRKKASLSRVGVSRPQTVPAHFSN